MISPSSIYMVLRNLGTSLFNALSGRTFKGIRIRIILASVLACLGMAADSSMMYFNYDYIPSYIGADFGWDYAPAGVESKSMFWIYELERIVLLAVFTAAGWLIYRKNRNSITRFRIFCLLEETANLIILTYVGMSIAILYLSLGDDSQKVSEKWELTVLLFWLVILLWEFSLDLRFFRKQKSERNN